MTTESTPTLETTRFILRELVRADAAALYPTFADEESMRWWSRAPFTDLDDLASYLTENSPGWDARTWAVVDKSGGPAIGRVTVADRGDGICELGYVIAKERMRQGVASEALAAVIAHLFAVDGKRRIYADTDPDNAGSNRLLEKLGFKLEGRLREQWTTHIGRRDSFIWGLLVDEWSSPTS
ncbi:GNAT family N-acetyltransferase [Altererythrobacter salegens]|uniref:GNAT family N-acetyltransferase n=1 Tax=Croceibacterium salegens TaxID=1737568 RepID=A0A6I4SWV6_9SPHN|nr:GNAT family protein [Croceibacterium salegens]MXO59306.1 GNAT family N-acetyltransferase [Croceibacterium salegens]